MVISDGYDSLLPHLNTFQHLIKLLWMLVVEKCHDDIHERSVGSVSDIKFQYQCIYISYHRSIIIWRYAWLVIFQLEFFCCGAFFKSVISIQHLTDCDWHICSVRRGIWKNTANKLHLTLLRNLLPTQTIIQQSPVPQTGKCLSRLSLIGCWGPLARATDTLSFSSGPSVWVS